MPRYSDYPEDYYDDMTDEEMERIGYVGDGTFFADPGGGSALRAETRDNPRDQPCPNCGVENILTRADRARGYQCDSCADRAEQGW